MPIIRRQTDTQAASVIFMLAECTSKVSYWLPDLDGNLIVGYHYHFSSVSICVMVSGRSWCAIRNAELIWSFVESFDSQEMRKTSYKFYELAIKQSLFPTTFLSFSVPTTWTSISIPIRMGQFTLHQVRLFSTPPRVWLIAFYCVLYTLQRIQASCVWDTNPLI